MSIQISYLLRSSCRLQSRHHMIRLKFMIFPHFNPLKYFQILSSSFSLNILLKNEFFRGSIPRGCNSLNNSQYLTFLSDYFFFSSELEISFFCSTLALKIIFIANILVLKYIIDIFLE